MKAALRPDGQTLSLICRREWLLPLGISSMLGAEIYRRNNHQLPSWLQWDWNKPAAQTGLADLEDGQARKQVHILAGEIVPDSLATALDRLEALTWPPSATMREQVIPSPAPRREVEDYLSL